MSRLNRSGSVVGFEHQNYQIFLLSYEALNSIRWLTSSILLYDATDLTHRCDSVFRNRAALGDHFFQLTVKFGQFPHCHLF